jgi:8-oxo-dGTP pyrophosphatase MutT (NUDIX family)
MQDTEPALRQAGRVLVIDPAGQVLLLEGFDPAAPDRRYWVTIGGGLDDGEEPAHAAVRELREETGIVAAEDELVGPHSDWPPLVEPCGTDRHHRAVLSF